MAKTVFNKQLPHACAYCAHGKPTGRGDGILCPKHGVTQMTDSCRHYQYDVFKRVPQKKIDSGEFSAKDFEI